MLLVVGAGDFVVALAPVVTVGATVGAFDEVGGVVGEGVIVGVPVGGAVIVGAGVGEGEVVAELPV